MTLSDNLTSFSATLAKLPQQRIAQLLSVLLLIYIAFLVAKITWLVAPQQQSLGNATVTSHTDTQTGGDERIDITGLQALNLFGQYQKAVDTPVAVEQVKSAPETRLQLTLSGLVASDDKAIAAAIIEHKKKQATYGIGDIITGTRASLEQVLIDRVIIKQSGRFETLMLDGADYNQPAQSVATKQSRDETNEKSAKVVKQGSTVDQRNNTNLSASAKALRNDLANNPGKITDYLRINPVRTNGSITGYRLSPGKNPEFFTLSGLKSGDVAKQMNGYDLLAPLEAAQAMSALKTERDISLLVERSGALIEILFSIE